MFFFQLKIHLLQFVKILAQLQKPYPPSVNAFSSHDFISRRKKFSQMAKTLQTQALPSESVSYELISVISSHNNAVCNVEDLFYFQARVVVSQWRDETNDVGAVKQILSFLQPLYI